MLKKNVTILFVLLLSMTLISGFAQDLPLDDYYALENTGLEIRLATELKPIELSDENRKDHYIASAISPSELDFFGNTAI